MYGTIRDYYESAEDISISRTRALSELEKHNINDPTEFYEQMGFHQHYPAQDVLRWLGY